MTRRVVIEGDALSIEDVVAVAAGEAVVEVGSGLDARMAPARALVVEVLDTDRTVYGITTGFGALATTHVAPADAAELQYGLLRSHAAAVGPPLPAEIVRAMLLLRARTLAQGYSGVRPVVVKRIVDLLSRDLLPVVPGQGSVGASGDLAQFAHLALPLIGEGLLTDAGGPSEAAGNVLNRHGIEPLNLEPKEGLSLLNGTEGMLARGVLALVAAEKLVDAADAACALSVEALLASERPFEPRVHELRPHPGQMTSAAIIRALLRDSQICASHADDFIHAVQDAYSLRCAPQVHGAVRDVLTFSRDVFTRELGAVVDNPIVFAESGDVVSAGNFHGQPLAFALDFLAIACTEVGSISERRTDRILDPDRSSGLTAFLARRPGIDSGFMLAQYTAAALVAENRVLAHPASIDSIPTSGLQEDHVSMGWGAARKLDQVIVNATLVVAAELMCAAQAVEDRVPLTPADGTAGIVDLVRSVTPALKEDRPIGQDIEAVAGLIASGAVTGVVGEALARNR